MKDGFANKMSKCDVAKAKAEFQGGEQHEPSTEGDGGGI
jgi:hypothetical protein